MYVEKIKKISKTKSKIYLDSDESFSLYNGELYKFKIKEGEELKKEIYDEIMKNVLPKRAIARCNNILAKSDRTSGQIRQTLQRGGYPKDIIEDTIEYLIKRGYINDLRYARNYISYNKDKKSVEMMKAYLITKGIKADDISVLLEEFEETLEEEQKSIIKKLIERKCKENKDLDYSEKMKVKAYLSRKGYKLGLINLCMEEYLENG